MNQSNISMNSNLNLSLNESRTHSRGYDIPVSPIRNTHKNTDSNTPYDNYVEGVQSSAKSKEHLKGNTSTSLKSSPKFSHENVPRQQELFSNWKRPKFIFKSYDEAARVIQIKFRQYMRNRNIYRDFIPPYFGESKHRSGNTDSMHKNVRSERTDSMKESNGSANMSMNKPDQGN